MIKHLSMKLKVAILLGIMVVGLLTVTAMGLFTLRQTLLEDRKSEIKTVITSSISIAQAYQDQVTSGELTQEEAIKIYYDGINGLKFAGDIGYVFSYDDHGIVQAHGANPALTGKDLSGVTDANGVKVIQALIDASNGKNDGYFSYVWDKPGQDKKLMFEKVSYAGKLPWGHHIGTGLYVDDLDATFWRIAIRDITVSAIAILIATIIGWIISRDISKSLFSLRRSMDDISEGNYNNDISGIDRRDELGAMANSVLGFREKIQENEALKSRQEQMERETRENRIQETLAMSDNLEGRVKNLVQSISQSISNLHVVASDMNTIADESSNRANDVAAATEETSANVETVAAATEELTASSDEISQQVNNSTQVAQHASEQVDQTNATVKNLANAIDKISEVVSLIDAITDQTNLLALNATIEAARAGEAGKGFAVVASEVRNLANQTARATADITGQISNVQTESGKALTAVNEINATINSVAENSTAIAAAIEEQHAAIREIARNVNQASDGTRAVSSHIADVSANANKTLESTNRVTSSADELRKESEALENEVEAFLNELRAKAADM
ncbi:methyl-accepting chemotaxis protein [Terasakiella pusilla]|uniref:methyl-accepting chemotaxis protein n=1 Tax=Terasakiella pusilla TaxID=64973 RepID=UPI003AA7AE2C